MKKELFLVLVIVISTHAFEKILQQESQNRIVEVLVKDFRD